MSRPRGTSHLEDLKHLHLDETPTTPPHHAQHHGHGEAGSHQKPASMQIQLLSNLNHAVEKALAKLEHGTIREMLDEIDTANIRKDPDNNPYVPQLKARLQQDLEKMIEWAVKNHVHNMHVALVGNPKACSGNVCDAEAEYKKVKEQLEGSIKMNCVSHAQETDEEFVWYFLPKWHWQMPGVRCNVEETVARWRHRYPLPNQGPHEAHILGYNIEYDVATDRDYLIPASRGSKGVVRSRAFAIRKGAEEKELERIFGVECAVKEEMFFVEGWNEFKQGKTFVSADTVAAPKKGKKNEGHKEAPAGWW
ncbi:hypothetical protein QBC46DRAFT_429269 [Diplogelasinospora grovesii]|uniref:Uncharacterized protein n=1 Tax=Diplogelasinospora grovesii TaxID=303347 RepID=A0AAN6MV70_9PEZI|nr:hypothetical protein QBC46DRAFT_429269 [Diplogelasinospora grovesii]